MSSSSFLTCPINQLAICLPPTIILAPASHKPPLKHGCITGPERFGLPISASDLKQFVSPISVFLIISLHNLQKLLGRVIGVPSGCVMIDATPVASANKS